MVRHETHFSIRFFEALKPFIEGEEPKRGMYINSVDINLDERDKKLEDALLDAIVKAVAKEYGDIYPHITVKIVEFG